MTVQASITTGEAQIRELLDDWTRAVCAKDLDRVMSHYATDIVIFDLAPPLESTGADTLRRSLEAWFSTWQGPLDYEIRDPNITAGEDVAFGRSLNRLRGTKTDGEQADVWFRQTLCFEKIESKWRIAHQHESVPFYMDGSYRAAVDLEP